MLFHGTPNFKKLFGCHLHVLRANLLSTSLIEIKFFRTTYLDSGHSTQWQIQDFENWGLYSSVREERQKFLLDHAHF